MNQNFKILAIGDVVGAESVKHLSTKLWNFRQEHGINMVVCNAENAAVGNGLDPQTADKLLAAGCDVLTGGNHIFKKKEIRSYLENSQNLIRPANFPSGTPGSGYTTINIDGYRILVVNLIGQVLMEPFDCPFNALERILAREEGCYDFSILDIHAETTSEKLALAYCFDGKIDCIFGTHTHVQTADEQLLPKRTGYITDLGMTGPSNSVLGVRSDIIIEKLRTKLPVKFEPATGNIKAHGAIFELDSNHGCRSVTRIAF